MSVPFFLSLGSNLGQREEYLEQAIKYLQSYPALELLRFSSIYETEPVDYLDQPCFLNMVVMGRTSLTAHDLLGVTQQVEQQLGRKREIRFGPRTIDIDILLYNNKQISDHQLVIPHPRMLERAFVMIPLAEIAPDLLLPRGGISVGHVTEGLLREDIRKWKSPFLLGESESELLEN